MHCSLSAVLVTSPYTHFISYTHSLGSEEEAVLCLWLQGRCVCLLSPLSIPASSLAPSLLSSVRLSIRQPVIRLFVRHPFFSVLCEAACWCCVSFFIVQCELCKLALWKAVPLKELHINVTLPTCIHVIQHKPYSDWTRFLNDV